MKSDIKNITVLGDGGWGTTLSIHLAKKNYAVKLWGPFPEYIHQMRRTHTNPKFLSGISIPLQVELTEDLKSAIEPAQLIILAIPSQYVPAVLKEMKKIRGKYKQKIILSVVKGMDNEKLLRISQLIEKNLGKVPLAVLSGPNIALEVAKGVPSTSVIASKHLRIAKILQEIFNSDTFRVYTNTDVAGVELGGSVKNIIAIACGVCDGLGFGSNTKAAILTRGLAEMARLGVAMGAKEKTFTGLSGLGDLVTTSFSLQSRNRSVGEQLGKGKTIQQIISHMDMVAEGVETVKAIHKLSQRRKIPMPITTEIYNIIYNNKPALEAVQDLMSRKAKSE